MADKTSKLLKSMKAPSVTPIATEMVLPNHSGVQSHRDATGTFVLKAGDTMTGDLIMSNLSDIIGDGSINLYTSTGKTIALRIDDDGTNLTLAALGAGTIEIEDAVDLLANNLTTTGAISGDAITATGQVTFTHNPTGAGITNSSVVINPASASANGVMLWVGLADSIRLTVDEGGDVLQKGTKYKIQSVNAPNFEMVRDRSGASIGNGSNLFVLQGGGIETDVTNTNSARLSMLGDGAWNVGTTPTRWEFLTTPAGSTTPTAHVTLDNAGAFFFHETGSGLPYGSLYLHEGAENIDIATAGQGTYVKVTGLTTGLTNNVTINSDAFNVDKVGVYKIDWSISGDSQGANKVYECDIFLNGVEQSDGSGRSKWGNAGDENCMGGTALIDVTDTGHDIDIRIKEPGAGAGTDIDLYHVCFNIVHIGGT